MTSPLKPWENKGFMNGRLDSQNYSGSSSVRFRIPPRIAKSSDTMDHRDSPPPIPSRQRNDENRLSNQLNAPYYGGSSYGMYGGYGYGSSGYGGYGISSSPYLYNRPLGYGSNNMAPSTFARRAEDSCQPAFESVQSIVQAFASIATMLDSTFFAVHSSFRAVLGVADQLSNLRTHIANTLGAFTIFKIINTIFKKIMRFLRLRRSDVDTFESDAWSDATKDITESRSRRNSKSWPVVLFFAVVLGTPWLIWKLLQTISNDDNIEDWITGNGEHFEAEAEYDFDAENDDEVSFQAGDLLRVAPKHKQPHVRGWLLASSNGKIAGLVPANHVKILGRRKGYGRNKRKRPTTEMNKDKVEEFKEQPNEELATSSNESQSELLNDIYEDKSADR